MLLYEELNYLNNLQEDLTKQQLKFRDKNLSNTEVGSSLFTLKGSRVCRCGVGVGKLIGGQIYAHKNYLGKVLPQELYEQCIRLIKTDCKDFKFNCFNFNTITGKIALQEAPDFDTAREPVVGRQLDIFSDGRYGLSANGRFYNQIWHHKWLWVTNDYTGFDVAENWEWSKEWLSTLTEPANGTSQEAWEGQLAKFGLH